MAFFPASAKSQVDFTHKGFQHTVSAPLRGRELRSLETKLAPFMHARMSKSPLAKSDGDKRLTQADLFALARNWKRLSPEFTALYKSAVTIPAGMIRYRSPGGMFDVYYTTSGRSAVNATDTYGYSSADWRTRTEGANGTPDYVDEVAWAADSAWSMEIEKFGFGAWVPYSNSTPYKILIIEQEPLDYGMTYPDGKIPGQDIGFFSFIEMRNEWQSEAWANTPYASAPEQAVHITVVHEFFHAIQYAMMRDDWNYDGFPLAWLEGTAVLMEDLGFDHVNDYIQYAEDYFKYPSVSVFNDNLPWTLNVTIYLSAIPAMYLYEFCPGPGGAGIDFIKRIFVNNYSSLTGFHDNLISTAGTFGTTWSELLGDFHTRSYFTGDRSVPGMFLDDAPELPEWSYAEDIYTNGAIKTKSIRPFALGTFFYDDHSGSRDSLTIQFSGRREGETGVHDNQWAGNILLRPNGHAFFNTIVPTNIHLYGSDTVVIHSWPDYEAALFVVSNTHPTKTGEATVAFDSLFEDTTILSAIHVFPNPFRLDGAQELTVSHNGLAHMSIYNLAGSLVADTILFEDDFPRVYWNAKNRDGRNVVPGTYFIVTGYRETPLGRVRYKRHKLLVVP